MKIKTVVVGSYQTNCYILHQEEKVLIIDPGDEFNKIKEEVGKDQVVGILLTHRHFDHIGALEECMKAYQVPVFEYKNLEEREYEIESFHFKVLFTPGHTEDSVTYIFEENSSIFTGDFIFQGTIGRTDLGGNIEVMNHSLHKILNFFQKLDHEYTIYPGHEDQTMVTMEMKYNPYLQI